MLTLITGHSSINLVQRPWLSHRVGQEQHQGGEEQQQGKP
jgi:hypothetical protein